MWIFVEVLINSLLDLVDFVDFCRSFNRFFSRFSRFLPHLFSEPITLLRSCILYNV